MTLWDTIIIYLALGAPFGTHLAFRPAGESKLDGPLKFALGLLAWPFFAAQLGFRLKSNSASTPRGASQIELEALRLTFENECFGAARPSELFEFRGVFERYTHLILSMRPDISRPPAVDLLAAVGHPRPAVASRCIARRADRLLARFADLARADLLALDSELDGDASERFRALSLRASILLGDEDAMRELKLAADRSSPAELSERLAKVAA